MKKLVECIPNFSEGKNGTVIKKLADAINKIKNVRVLNYEMDADHNRSVITFAGYKPYIYEAAFNACELASQLIDLSMHKGCHPRIGAMDVLPFVPIKNISFKELVDDVRELGKKIGEEIKIPVYLYEKAAIKPGHVNLAQIRKGCFEKLNEKLKIDPPDFGPLKAGPAGATAVGVRKFLIAYNINLETENVEIAKKIAEKLRERDGGLPAVKALGLKLKELCCTQVSMNLTDFEITSIENVFDACEKEAHKFGIKIRESELIGLIPKKALENVQIDKLKFKNFSEDKILDNRLRDEGFEV